MSFSDVLSFLKQPVVLITIIVIAVLGLGILVFRAIKKSGLEKRFSQCEVKYNECISIPIAFKLNKANNIAKTNPANDETVQLIKKDYDDIEKRHEEISIIMADIEDAFAYRKLGLAKRSISDLEELLEDLNRITLSLNVRLDSVLEEEVEQREEITELKDDFRVYKTKLMGSANIFSDSYEVLEQETKAIESKFSLFEEWMFASDYTKASDLSNEICEDIKVYRDKIAEIPGLYETARGTIPQMLDSLSELYQDTKAMDVYMEHLEVPKNIGLLAELLKEDFRRLKAADLEAARESLENSQTRLEHLGAQIEKEKLATQEMRDKTEVAFAMLDELLINIEKLKETAPIVEKRFGFTDLVERTNSTLEAAQAFDEKRQHIVESIAKKENPATVLLISVNELKYDIEMLAQDFYNTQEQVNQANADEIRARKQLMKLYLIINDVEVRIKRRSLPTISTQYHEDLQRSRSYVRQIQDLLNQEILDVVTLNGTVAEAIDYIYQLHNNVNNLVGVVDMCENAIVYANKYRAYVPNIDSELTKAELAFNNGEYTQSLTMIINAIDRYKPNPSYEEMIRDNAQSAY